MTLGPKQPVHRVASHACRHTFAAWAIATGDQLFYLSQLMGTSVTQIDQTYGHLVPDLRTISEDSSIHLTRCSALGKRIAIPCKRMTAGVPSSRAGAAVASPRQGR
jgi:hypothetical protein